MPTLLHVLAPAPVGGLESVVRALAGGQVSRGHRVHAALVVEPGIVPALAASLESAGVETHVLELGARAYLAERAAIEGLAQFTGADIVHTHGYRPDVIAASAARAAGVKVVSTVHGFIGGSRRGRLNEWVQRRALRRAEAVIAVSRPLVERLASAGISRDRIHLLPNAWAGSVAPLDRAAARRALGLTEGRTTLGWVGRLSPEKGPDLLLDALATLGDLPLDVSILGGGRDAAALQARTEGWNGPRVRWHGVLADASRYFAAFDVYALTSRTEGTPISLLEAVAGAVPVIATAVGGVPDVTGADGAILVPPDASAIAAGIRSALGDPASGRIRAQAARRRLDSEFSADRWLDRHDAIYQSLLGRSTVTAS